MNIQIKTLGMLLMLSILVSQTATAMEYSNGRLSDNGQSGTALLLSDGATFVFEGLTNTVTISGGTYEGNDGGFSSNQDFPPYSIIEVTAYGGHGADLNGFETISVIPSNEVSFTGGNGGTALATAGPANAYADAGNGLSIGTSRLNNSMLTVHTNIVISQDGNLTVSDGTLTGGSAIFIPRNDIYIGNAHLTGGNGLAINSSANLTVIDGSSNWSSDGLTIVDSELNSVHEAWATNALVLETNLTIYPGIFSFYSTNRSLTTVEIEGGTYIGGHGGHAEGLLVASAKGGHGFYLYDGADLSLKNARFLGGNGGTAIQTDAPNSSYLSSASGGAGIMGNMVLSTSFSNVVAQGGNGGSASGTYPSVESYDPPYYYSMHSLLADGGDGAHLYRNPDSGSTTSLVQNSSFRGGNGGQIRGDLDTGHWNNASVAGGNGLEINAYGSYDATNSLTLRNVNAYGGNGGQAFDKGGETFFQNINANVSGGTGAHINGFHEVVIDGGQFIGGQGGKLGPKHPITPDEAAGYIIIDSGSIHGGAGMYLGALNAVIHGGSFIGGTSDRMSGNGLIFYGDTLEIFDGEFISPEGPYFFTGTGLDAHVSESITLHGGTYSSISTRAYGGTNDLADFYLGSSVTNNGYLSLNGNFSLTAENPELKYFSHWGGTSCS